MNVDTSNATPPAPAEDSRIHSGDPATDAALQHVFTGLKDRAMRDGWSPSQAEWVARFAVRAIVPRLGKGIANQVLIEEGYAEGKRLLAEAYFNNALSEGKNRITAFLTVADLERQVRERSGKGGGPYPEAWLKAACAAVEAAADRGAPSAEQIAAGFASIETSAKRVAGSR